MTPATTTVEADQDPDEGRRSPSPWAVEVDDLAALIPDWLRSLRAQNKAKATIESYSQSASQFLAFLQRSGMPTRVSHIRREHVETFIEDVLGRWSPATANGRYRALRRLFAFLEEEGEITTSPMAKMHPPSIPEPVTAVLSDDDLRALFRSCEVRKDDDDTKRFAARRDMAMLRLLADTGCRAGEIIGLKVEDVDREAQVIFVTGKGSRPRVSPYGPRTAQAIDRYMRLRGRHRLASLPDLWIGLRGRITDAGLRQNLARRSEEAGLGRVHPHMFRHTYAHRWLSQGGTEGDLMKLAGWRTRSMIDRYGASAAVERAHDAYRRMGLGDEV